VQFLYARVSDSQSGTVLLKSIAPATRYGCTTTLGGMVTVHCDRQQGLMVLGCALLRAWITNCAHGILWHYSSRNRSRCWSAFVWEVVCPGVLQGCAGTARFHSAVPAQHLIQGRCRHRWYIALRCGHGSVPTVPCGHRTVFKCGAHTALPCICRTGTALFLCAVRARPFYTVLCRHRTVFKCGAGTTRLRKIPWLQHIRHL